MASLYTQQDDTFFNFDDALSPSTALFPLDLSAPYDNALLNLPFIGRRQSISASSDGGGGGSTGSGNSNSIGVANGGGSGSGNGGGSDGRSYRSVSRLVSLSPSSSQVPSLQPAPSDLSSRSPHSSESPNSTFSFGNDDFLNSSFTASELDMLFQSNAGDFQHPPSGKSGHPFFFPSPNTATINTTTTTANAANSNINTNGNGNSLNSAFNFGVDGNGSAAPNLGTGTGTGAGIVNGSVTSDSYADHDDTFDLLNLVDSSPMRDTRRYSVVSTESYPVQPGREHQIQTLQHRASNPNMGSMGVTPALLQQGASLHAQGLQQHQRQHQQAHQQAQQQTMPPQWMNQVQGDANSWARVKQEANQSINFSQQATEYLFNASEFNSAPQVSLRRSMGNKAPGPRPANSKRQLKSDSDSPPGPGLGKHNKTERRYRQKVQAAQADLRDSVPALRVLYGTSTEEQRRTTDVRSPDGTIDGLGEVGRPNASAKTTIFLGARMYIELLQQRVGTLQRKVGELEAFRAGVDGEDALHVWREAFDAQERERLALQTVAKADDESFSDEDEENEEEASDEPKRKKPKAAPAPKGRGKKSKEDPNFGSGGPSSSASNGVRVFAAFAMSFSLLPSASTLFQHVHVPLHLDNDASTTSQQIYSRAAPAGTSEVLARLPLIVAEHAARLLARRLPQAAVPHPHTLVDWTWRLLVAVVLAVLLGPLLSRKRTASTATPRRRISGTPVDIVTDTLKLAVRRKEVTQADKAECSEMAEAILGSVTRAPAMVKWHTTLRLAQCADDAYTLALLALLQPTMPFVPSSEELWKSARSHITDKTASAVTAVLALPFHEAMQCLELAPRSSAPIAAMAEQIHLVHINDLLSRLFVRLVDASTGAGVAPPVSVKALSDNLAAKSVAADLKASAFDKEIRGIVTGVPKGSAAHALGLVLIGLWGVFTGPVPAAQAALASALAAEELRAGARLESVSAMLELLYPGSSTAALDRADRAILGAAAPVPIPRNAVAIDRLAQVCISYIRLLASARQLNDTDTDHDHSTRVRRVAASRAVHTVSVRIRALLAQTAFVGLGRCSGSSDPWTGFVEGDVDADAEESGGGGGVGGVGNASKEEGGRDEAHEHGRGHGRGQGQGQGQGAAGEDDGKGETEGEDEWEGKGERQGETQGERQEKALEHAKETLVGVLSMVGRRASGRAQGRDEDSGLEGELDEI